MGTLSQLLRWKKSITLKDEKGNPILGEDEKPVTVWIRIISDKDLEDAFLRARIESAQMRAKLLDESTDEYKALIDPFSSASYDQCYDMAIAGMGANWMGEALSTVERPELPKITEVALDPDAPSLEEQEKLDAAIHKAEEKYQKGLQEFIETKTIEARTELDALSEDELQERAKQSVMVTVPLETFLSELQDNKLFRAVYYDKECSKRGFSDVEDYRATSSVIREQIQTAYEELEAGHSQIKN